MTSMYRLNLKVQHVLQAEGHYALQDVQVQHDLEEDDHHALHDV